MIKLDLRVSHFVQARFIIAYYIHNQNGGVLQLFLREGETKAIYLPHETSINHFFKNNWYFPNLRSGLNFGQNKVNILL